MNPTPDDIEAEKFWQMIAKTRRIAAVFNSRPTPTLEQMQAQMRGSNAQEARMEQERSDRERDVSRVSVHPCLAE